MSRDGYLPPGCLHRDVDRAADDRDEDDYDDDELCPACGAPGEFRNGRMTCCGATARDMRYL
jgi:hypothetical protein